MSKKRRDVLIQYLNMEMPKLDLAHMETVFAASGIVRDAIGGLGQDMKVGTMELEKQSAVDVESRLRIQVF